MSEKRIKESLRKFLKEKRLAEGIFDIKKKLNAIPDIVTLFKYKKRFTFGSSPYNLVENRGEELLVKEISKTFNMSILIKYWEEVATDTKSEKLIVNRIKELFAEVNIANIPEWFLQLVEQVSEEEKELPLFMRDDFVKKVQEVYFGL